MDLSAILQENEQLKSQLDYSNVVIKNTKMTLGQSIDENINLRSQVEMLQLKFQQYLEQNQKKTEQPEDSKKDEIVEQDPEKENESIKDDDLDADSIPV